MDPNSMETYFGLIKTPHDALIIFEACHLGIISRVHRRLSDIERQSVRSGSVYCFDEREAGMRRWTDGKSWSPSRVTGSFLTYRELEDTPAAIAPAQSKNIYRADGLLKQSFSITTSDNKKLHLISYYTNEDVSSERLFETPSRDHRFANVVIPRGIYPETSATAVADAQLAGHALGHSSPSPPTPHRSRHRPHHRAFQPKDGDVSIGAAPTHRRTDSASSALSIGHGRSNSSSLKEHRYSPIHSTGDVRSRSNSHSYSISHSYNSVPRPDPLHQHRYKSTSPSVAGNLPTPPSNVYSPTGSWASDDDQPLVADIITPESMADSASSGRLTPIMIPALRDLPLLHQSFPKSTEPFTPTSATSSEQDSLSVLANLATVDPLLLPKLEPKEISRERVRWVEDDRQLRALSSMLRL